MMQSSPGKKRKNEEFGAAVMRVICLRGDFVVTL